MPVVLSNNNRVLPANSRAVDVAQAAIRRIIPVQNRRYDNAFQVQGFQAILYMRLNSGLPCQCKTRNKSLSSALNRDGIASPGVINELLTGGGEFGYRRYGSSTPTQTQTYEVQLGDSLPSLFGKTHEGILGTSTDRYASNEFQAGATTIIRDGVGVNGPVEIEDDLLDMVEESFQDTGLLAHSDVACPICFGSGYVGGYSILNGVRTVLVPQTASSLDGYIDIAPEVPNAKVKSIAWTITLPYNPVGVDALTVYNSSSVLSTAVITVDTVALTSAWDLLRWCDGKSHLLEVTFPEPTEFTHVELQINSSTNWVNFGFPKVTKGSTQTMLENTEQFSITVSPLVPRISPLDIIADSTYGKRFQVKSVPTWNDSDRNVLGWGAELRPTQPQELFRLLPVRLQVKSGQRPNLVTDNLSGSRRT